AGARRDALDPDVARGRIRLGAEAVHVVGVQALAGDRVGIEKGLVAARRLARAVTGEVLVVDERRGVVRPDEVDVVRVDPVGDPGHLDARAGDAERTGRRL